MIEPMHFPEFATRPDAAYLARWRSHIATTGMPETFDRVSTSRPEQKDDIILLSEEIRVPTGLRPGGDGVPCPFCSPTAPKFGKGRMAYFQQESVVRFVGHRCAKTHFGENYADAEQLYRRQEAVQRYLKLWIAVADGRPAIESLLDRLLIAGEAAEQVRRDLEIKAPGVCNDLHRELLQEKGDLTITEDLGMRDRNGNAVIQRRVIGTSAGLSFLSEGFHPVKAIKRATQALALTTIELPAWEATTPEHRATDDILKLGTNLTKALAALPNTRTAIEDAARFLTKQNMDLLNRWGTAASSIYTAFEIKKQGEQLVMRMHSFRGQFYANAVLPEASALEPPGLDDPGMTWARDLSDS